MLPFERGSDEQLATLRGALRAAGYTADRVCERAGCKSMYDFVTLREGRGQPAEVADELDLLIRLFLDGEPVDGSLVHDLMSPAALEALSALRLLRTHPEQPDACAASVQLYPTEGLYIVSDLGTGAPGIATAEEQRRTDSVYSAIASNTGNFLRSLPTSPCARLLELCSGTGVAALLGAASAGHAWAVDISARSTAFAEFNARLNGVEGVTILQGDLYQPVAGQSFDRIIAHPPYVPAPDRVYLYAHAGIDGEDVVRALLAGLPDHLSPGGGFYCTCLSTDRRDAPLEQRIRAMIGEREAEFDVLLVEHYGYHPTEFYLRLAAGGGISFELADRHRRLFKELQAEKTVYCSMVVQRVRAPRETVTLRRERGARSGSEEIEWLLRWMEASVQADMLETVLAARPALSPDARLRLTHEPADGDWRIATCHVTIDYPFPQTVEIAPGAARFLPTCDGTVSTREQLARLKRSEVVPRDMTEEVFAGFVLDLVGEGVLRIDELQPPRAMRPAPATTER